MNPSLAGSVDTDAGLERLERIATQAANERRKMREVGFFSNAMRTLPLELLMSCELTGVGRIDSEYYGFVRVRLSGAEFDVEQGDPLRPQVHHAGLPLTPALRDLEDYSLERARSLETRLRRQLLLSWIPALSLTGLLAVMIALNLSRPLQNIHVVTMLLATLATGIVVVVTASNWPARAWRLVFKPRYATPDAVTIKAFEQWRAGLETRGEA